MGDFMRNFAMVSIFWLLIVATAVAEGTLAIVAPAHEATVAPGSVLSIVVQVTDPTDFESVTLESELSGNLGGGPSEPSASQLTFKVKIPLSQRRGNLALRAFARSLSTGKIVRSQVPFALKVENSGSDLFVRLNVSPAELRLTHLGDSSPLSIAGILSNGTRASLADSDQLTVMSLNNNVVQIGTARSVKNSIIAVGEGLSQIRVTYGNMMAHISVEVESPMIPGDLDGDGDVDSQDYYELQSFFGEKANLPFDAKDLDKDGQVTAADCQILKGLCTRAQCASGTDLSGGIAEEEPTATPQVSAIDTAKNLIEQAKTALKTAKKNLPAKPAKDLPKGKKTKINKTRTAIMTARTALKTNLSDLIKLQGGSGAEIQGSLPNFTMANLTNIQKMIKVGGAAKTSPKDQKKAWSKVAKGLDLLLD
jgi:hypothetical protein